MLFNLRNIILLLSVCLGLGACCAGEEETLVGKELTVGDKVPDFSVKMRDGRVVTDKDLLGNVSLIVFFHTGCKDCRKELPVLQRFHDDYPSCPLVCISRAETESSIVAYWEEAGLTLPYSPQTDTAVFNLFATHTVPRIYVVDARGIIHRIFTDNPLAEYEDLVEARKECLE